ncbi:hypothetical protein [Paenibacillus tengchongensis]|uniref:hypothetical protein n=1 Tax=Paenibacillus tengchongensis TaxID=2608684 RepID=UPI00124DA732|nr:hypothetical protein [Paenibacillus tengchongensis]
MNIQVLKRGLRHNEIYFLSAFGEGRGIWHGPEACSPGSVLEAEFEVPGLLMRWIDIVPAAERSAAAIALDGGSVVLTGVLESIEEDGAGYLRLGDTLVMFECLGEPMALGGYVELRTDALMLYPVYL